ncbi:MAG: 16S rRNA (cytosine(1402)-N(4))-methyltransferase RsmH [Deltaproteobacteria bacterium]|jgi:16S rRNA (cytosine1402-N4)-methyltransferase|nr:16S rRNA (cytosine(1402)-N(4))-methyltransferase RsmH [Deltaproteobacteria bacterium]
MTVHVPVMLEEVLQYLAGGQRLLDCTLGGGGHSKALLLANPNLQVVAFDQDLGAIEQAKENLGKLWNRVLAIQGNFGDIKKLLATVTPPRQQAQSVPVLDRILFDRILVDLGISSDQLDDSQRGFSFAKDGPLDMRMDLKTKLTAAEVVNNFSYAQLKSVLISGGMRKNAAAVLADVVIKSRPIKSTWQLRDICEELLFKQRNSVNKHLAAVPFQAIRIAVNSEFAVLKSLLNEVLEFLAPQGRLAIISFHSLEDELVAKKMRSWSQAKTAPRGLAINNSQAVGCLLTKQAVMPTTKEVNNNSRARSARLRVFEKN